MSFLQSLNPKFAFLKSLATNETNNQISTETFKIPQREDMLKQLKSGEEYDILIIGGGCTGTGAALDAATRGLKVACVEREDFGSGTSSRSTKLLWGGSRYLVQAFVSVLSPSLFTSPIQTVSRFSQEFKMVLNCHRERNFMLTKQPHLAYWVPIAVPFTSWVIWPAPFNFYPAALGPLGLFPAFFKFYDALGGFNCPPSHIMSASRSERKFPQLANNRIKYCSVFYEGMHDDARTNLAIAQTAAKFGANIVNYCEVTQFVKDKDGVVVGAMIKDNINGDVFPVKSKSVLLCGGPFTDELRLKEDTNSKPAVTGASGIHIVLPSYYAPTGIGLVDMNTSDGRFLFFLPWNDHVLIGTTDRKCQPTSRPRPEEAEIQWLLHEASKYLSPELQLRRKDVLSAWCGIRPLATDPHAKTTSSASRDHVVSFNPLTNVVFVSGGKWTTFREMAEDAIDTVIKKVPSMQKFNHSKCKTLDVNFVGYEGYSSNLSIRLIQAYGLSIPVANRLTKAYGGRAFDVLQLALEQTPTKTTKMEEKFPEKFLISGFPYMEAEVLFATRFEWARHPEDFLAHRTRLAFVNRNAAISAIPRVVEIMGKELNWSSETREKEYKRCIEFMRHIGGPKPLNNGEVAAYRLAAVGDIADAFSAVDKNSKGYILYDELNLLSEILNYPISVEEIQDCGKFASEKFDCPPNQITNAALSAWWNSHRLNPELTLVHEANKANPSKTEGSGTMFG